MDLTIYGNMKGFYIIGLLSVWPEFGFKCGVTEEQKLYLKEGINMTNDEHKAYLQKHTENGVSLFNEIMNIDDNIAELKKQKRLLIKKYAHDSHLLNEGDRIEITWPNGITETVDICTPGASKVMHERNEYDVVYGYRIPNKDGTRSKIGALRTLWQGQLFVNGYKKLT